MKDKSSKISNKNDKIISVIFYTYKSVNKVESNLPSDKKEIFNQTIYSFNCTF